VWCHWGDIEPFSATLAQDGLAELIQLLLFTGGFDSSEFMQPGLVGLEPDFGLMSAEPLQGTVLIPILSDGGSSVMVCDCGIVSLL